jgi:hypothetical protein
LRKEHRLRVSENRVLRTIFGSKKGEVKGEWRNYTMRNFMICTPQQNIIRVIKSRRILWAGHVASMGESSGIYRVLVVEPEGKRPLGRSRRSWKSNIKMNPQEVGWEEHELG